MMQQYSSNSYLFGGNAPYVEELYEAYLDNPGSVPDNWRAYFDALPPAQTAERAHSPIIADIAARSQAPLVHVAAVPATAAEFDNLCERLEEEIDQGGFFKSPDLKPTVVRNIRNLFMRAEPTAQEINTLHGIISAIKNQNKS